MRRQLAKPKTVILRYPVLFGGFLLVMGTGFYFREYFLSDIEEQRSRLLMRQDDESNAVLADFIKEHQLKNMKP